MTALIARSPIAEAEEVVELARAAFAWARDTEWIHGRRCAVVGCRKCCDLTDATNAARSALDAAVDRLLLARAGTAW